MNKTLVEIIDIKERDNQLIGIELHDYIETNRKNYIAICGEYIRRVDKFVYEDRLVPVFNAYRLEE